MIEVNGFVMYTTSGQAPVLTYRHKPGVEYPVTCRLIPETNLQWKDYKFTGTIVKPDQAAWDSVTVGVLFHYQDTGNCYKLLFKRAGVYLDGGQWSELFRNALTFGGGDTLHFVVEVESDAKVVVYSEAWVNHGDTVVLANDLDDDSAGRVPDGEPAVMIDIAGATGGAPETLQPLRIVETSLKKTR